MIKLRKNFNFFLTFFALSFYLITTSYGADFKGVEDGIVVQNFSDGTSILQVDLTTGNISAETFIKRDNQKSILNSFGYNPKDDFVYGIESTSESYRLVKVSRDSDNDGSTKSFSLSFLRVPIKVISENSSPKDLKNSGVFITGDFDKDGNFWILNGEGEIYMITESSVLSQNPTAHFKEKISGVIMDWSYNAKDNRFYFVDGSEIKSYGKEGVKSSGKFIDGSNIVGSFLADSSLFLYGSGETFLRKVNMNNNYKESPLSNFPSSGSGDAARRYDLPLPGAGVTKELIALDFVVNDYVFPVELRESKLVSNGDRLTYKIVIRNIQDFPLTDMEIKDSFKGRPISDSTIKNTKISIYKSTLVQDFQKPEKIFIIGSIPIEKNINSSDFSIVFSKYPEFSSLPPAYRMEIEYSVNLDHDLKNMSTIENSVVFSSKSISKDIQKLNKVTVDENMFSLKIKTLWNSENNNILNLNNQEQTRKIIDEIHHKK